MSTRRHTKLIHEGQYAAEVEVTLIETEEGWSPYLSLADAEKLNLVKASLGRGDLAAASRIEVYQLTPVKLTA